MSCWKFLVDFSSDFRLLLLLTILALTGVGVESFESASHETNLKKKLFTGYDPSVRPQNVTTAVTLKFEIVLNQLIDLDERNQILVTSLWYRHVWEDAFMKWNTSHYGNLKVFRTRSNNVWLPDITLYNDVREDERSIDKFDVIVHYTGRIQWNYPIIMRSACRVDVRFFPFDQQICKFKYGSWSYDGFRLDLQNMSTQGDLSNFVPSGEWTILSFPVVRHLILYGCCPEPYPDLTFYVIMRRRPLFYLFNLVLPCLVIMVITFLGFLLPPDSGEKVSLGVTCLLALTVFLLLVAETMPPQSEVIPLIGGFFGGAIVLLSLSTSLTVVVLHLHFKGHHQNVMPILLKKFAFNFLARILFMRSLVYNLQREARIIKECHMMAGDDAEFIGFGANSTLFNSSFNNSTTKTKKDKEKNAAKKKTDKEISKMGNTLKKFSMKVDMLPLPTISNDGLEDTFGNNDSEKENEVLRLVRKILNKIIIFERLRIEEERSDMIESEWRIFALIFDRLMLVIFMLTGLITTCMYLLQGRDYSYDLSTVK